MPAHIFISYAALVNPFYRYIPQNKKHVRQQIILLFLQYCPENYVFDPVSYRCLLIESASCTRNIHIIITFIFKIIINILICINNL